MKRAIVSLLGTAAAVVWLAGYRTHPPRTVRAAARATPRAPARPNPYVRTVTGPAATTPFSVIQVQVTVTHGKLTGVRTVELTGDGPHTQALNARAEPILRREALRAGGADIDTVSGATYTSRSWRLSLQAALKRAHQRHGSVR